jgi:SOS response regulatory protein OraA/RecX
MGHDLRAVTEVRPAGRGSKRRLIFLEGDLWRAVASDVLKEVPIHSGDTVSVPELAAALAQVESRCARERGLRLIAARERSHDEVLKRLVDDGYSSAVASETADSLASTGLIDDDRLASLLARSLVEYRGLARGRALKEMTRRGISEERACLALDAVASPEAEPDRALAAAERLHRPGDTVTRLAGRLARRGFTSGQAYSAARAIVPDDDARGVCFDD